MIKNHIRSAWRNLTRNPLHTFIHILGLSVGIAAALTIMKYVSHEWSYDQFHTHYHDIYRVANDRYQQGKLIQHGTITYSAVGPALEEDFPEVINHTRMMTFGRVPIKIGDQVFIEDAASFADAQFFELFSFPLLAGDKASCLAGVRNIALSRSRAIQYFGVTEAEFPGLIGQIILVDEDLEPYTIQAIFEDFPANSHLQFHTLFSYESLVAAGFQAAEYSWNSSNFWHYVQLMPGADPQKIEDQLEAFSDRHFEGTKISGSIERFSLQPLEKAHLFSDYEYEIGETGNGQAIRALFAIAFFILVLAWINYINLSTARSLERAKEVGMRKVMGAERIQLIRQFLVEAFLLNIVCVLVALTLLQLLQPLSDTWLGAPISWETFLELKLLGASMPVWIGGFLLLGTLLSGLYPALVLSGFQPVTVLKGSFQQSTQGRKLRTGLVVFQFMCALVLMSLTLGIYMQLNFMKNHDLGLDITQTLVVEGPEMTPWDSTYIDKANALKAELRKIPQVLQVSTTREVPGGFMSRSFDLRGPHSGPDENLSSNTLSVDFDFISTYGLTLVAGRDFRATDHNNDYGLIRSVILNQTAIRKLSFQTEEEAIGQEINFQNHEWEIVGVVKDYHQVALQYPIEPQILIPAYSTNGYFGIKLQETAGTGVLSQVEATYATFFPGNAFQFFYLDEQFNEQYSTDTHVMRLFNGFTLLAILISCLGLFGLTSYVARQKTKEIGIRKVLGASLSNITSLLLKFFFRPIAIAALLAFPLAFWAVRTWILGYAYKVELSGWMFVIPLILILTLALLTVGYQTLKAALNHPVNALRYE